MVNRCIVCKSGKRNGSNTDVTFHRLPHNNPCLLKKWKDRLPRSIKITNSSYICSLHFIPTDFDIISTDKRRSKKELKHKRLKRDAIPSIFENISYKSTTRSYQSTSEYRRKKENDRIIEMEKLLNEQETVSNLTQLQEKLRICGNKPTGYTEISTEKRLTFLVLDNESDKPNIIRSVQFFDDLSVNAFIKNNLISPKAYSHIFKGDKITSVTQALNILAFVKNHDNETTNTGTESLIESAVELLEEYERCNGDEMKNNKIAFIIEQLKLLSIPKNQRHYSPSLLVFSSIWKAASTSCYRQMLQSNVLTLPSLSTLYRINNILSLRSTEEEITKYFQLKIQKLTDIERNVILIIDEVYVQKNMEYTGGKYFGTVDGELAKTVLCFMIKSLRHHYKDVVALFPCHALTSASLLNHFYKVNRLLCEIGFHIVAISADNASVNRSFYSILSNGSMSSTNPITGEPLHLIFDPTHLFKNFYNNFERKKKFIYHENDTNELVQPCFSHINELYEMERNMPLKLAHRLNQNVIKPDNIQRVSVKLAEACFHESTINAMEFYIKSQNKPWLDTLKFLKMIRLFWNILNIRTPTIGIRKRDEALKPIMSVEDDRIRFLKEFANLLRVWNGNSSFVGFSNETNTAAQQTCHAIIELITYLKGKGFTYILTGLFQSDPIEKRFGIYRQMSGGNYHISVRQIFESERKIKMQSLLKYQDFDTLHVLECLDDTNEMLSLFDKAIDMVSLIPNQNNKKFDESNFAISYYISGYASRVICRRISYSCENCLSLFSTNEIEPFKLEYEEGCDPVLSTKFAESIDRGGLCYPSDGVFYTCNLCMNVFETLTSDSNLKEKLVSDSNPRALFVEIVSATIMSLDVEVQQTVCDFGHDVSKYWKQITVVFFNCLSKNFVKRKKDSVKKQSTTSKIRKLRSE